MADFIRVPFAVEGDIAEIPVEMQVDGKVSMTTGFTFDYERDPSSDPNAKDIPRAETNGLYFLITDAIRQYQTEGAFPFITPDVNGGTAYPYIMGARCRYEGAVYESLVNNNTSLPTDGTKWRNTSAVKESTGYELGEFYFFRHPTVKPGFAPMQGGLISGLYQGADITTYPIWEYLQTVEGQMLCKTEAEWQAMTRAIWATLADGTQVGWDGIGGAPFFAPNFATGALRMPDVRGMYMEAAGFDSLDVGGVHGDMMRLIAGNMGSEYSSTATGPFYGPAANLPQVGRYGITAPYVTTGFSTDRVVPTGAKLAPRAFGVLPCVYLGVPR